MGQETKREAKAEMGRLSDGERGVGQETKRETEAEMDGLSEGGLQRKQLHDWTSWRIAVKNIKPR